MDSVDTSSLLTGDKIEDQACPMSVAWKMQSFLFVVAEVVCDYASYLLPEMRSPVSLQGTFCSVLAYLNLKGERKEVQRNRSRRRIQFDALEPRKEIKMRYRTSLLLILVFALTGAVYAQTDGSLRGYVKDESGAVLPGVTVTAFSPALIGPRDAVTDATGYYRILNLPPGDYVLTFELTSFATHRQEGIVLRAAANYSVDAVLKISAVQETITVSGESPMLEIARPGNVLNIEGEFQKDMPIAARRNWSDFLEMTPGVHSRPFDDGSGRMVYFGHSTEHFAHVVQLEGMQAGNYNDFQLTYVQMGSDMIEDTQVKTGGVDASTPMGTGLAINVITKSGGIASTAKAAGNTTPTPSTSTRTAGAC